MLLFTTKVEVRKQQNGQQKSPQGIRRVNQFVFENERREDKKKES